MIRTRIHKLELTWWRLVIITIFTLVWFKSFLFGITVLGRLSLLGSLFFIVIYIIPLGMALSLLLFMYMGMYMGVDWKK